MKRRSPIGFTLRLSVLKLPIILFIVSCLQLNLRAQTVLINPNGAGGFELGSTFASNGWTLVNYAGAPNTNWFLTPSTLTTGAFTFAPTGTRAAYASNDGGATWTYGTTVTASAVHFYRDVTFPAGEGSINLSFRWNANGEDTWDEVIVYLCPTTLTPVTGSPSSNTFTVAWAGTGTATLLGRFRLLAAGSGTTSSLAIPASLINNCSSAQTWRLVFTWKNDGSVQNEPPGAIDDISLTSQAGAAPLAGTYSIGAGGNYPTLTAAVNDVALNGVSAPVILQLKSTYTSGAETYPINLFGNAGCGPAPNSVNTVTIRPEPGAGVLSITGSNAGPTFNINNGNWWRIDGRAGGVGTTKGLIIANTSTTGQAIQYINDASNNIVRYCDVRGMNTSTTSGVIWFSTTSLPYGNDNNLIEFTDVHAIDALLQTPANCIYSLGTTTTSDQYNSNNTISNCNIYDFFLAAQSFGIFPTTGSTNWTITNNSFYQTVARAPTSTFCAIFSNNSTNVGYTISNNFIGGTAPNCGGGPLTLTGAPLFRAIQATMGVYPPCIMNANTIANINITTTNTGATGQGIGCTTGSFVITNNIIGSTTVPGSITLTYGTTTATTFAAITTTSTAVGASNVISGNTVAGLSFLNTSTSGHSLRGIWIQSATPFVDITNNIIGGTMANSLLSTGVNSVIGILSTGSIATTYNITGNAISNLTCSNTTVNTASSVRAMELGGALTTHNVQNNTISKLACSAQNTSTGALASVNGIAESNGGPGTIIANNSISDLNANATAGALQVNGIIMASTSPLANNVVDRNFIHSLTSTTPGVATINGINVTSTGLYTFKNNMIRLGVDAAGSNITSDYVLNGILETAGTNNYYHNSVWLGGTGVTGTANNTFGFNSSVVTNVRNYKDNIFVNARSNSAGAAKHYAIKVGGTAPNPTGLKSESNLLNVTGTGGVLGQFNAMDQATLAAWRATTGQDNNSITGDPKFINPTGNAAAVDLHISSSLATPIEGAGEFIPGLIQDFDNQTRATLTPVDIGADAGNFIKSDISAPGIGYIPLGNACGTSNILLSGVVITDATGVPTSGTLRPRIYYKKGAGSYFSQPGTLISGTSTNGLWDFTIVVSDMGGIVASDVISYYVIAQDINAIPLIGSNPGGVIATDVNTITTHPAVPNTMTVLASLSGTYTVGLAGVYTTLTAAVAAYNSACVNGPVVFSLIDATYPSEVFPITINQIFGQSSINTLTIKPAAGNVAMISGSSASCIIRFNGADWVILDGSNSGGTDRSLTLNNTSVAASTAVVCVQSLGTGLGATNDIIKNCKIVAGSNVTTSTFGIHVAGTTVSTSATGDDNDNLLIQNNDISSTYYGIYARASSVLGTNDNLQIIGNSIGSATAANYVTFRGMDISFANNSLISQNTIFNIVNTVGTSISGIEITSGLQNSTISRNNITGVSANNSGGWGAWGIDIASGTFTTNNLIVNNFISDIIGSNYVNSTTFNAFGIRLVGGLNTKIYNNSINMFGTPATGTNTGTISANILLASSTLYGTEIKNNILSNTQTYVNAGAFAYNIYAVTGAFIAVNDYNAFNGMTTGTTTYSVGFNGANVLTLPLWRIFTGQDFFSKSTAPSFVSLTDLHLNPVGNDCINQGGMPLAIVPKDFDDQTRSTTYPDIGADEFNGTNTTITVTETSNIPNDKIICAGASATITVVGATTHKWNTGATTSAITVTPGVTTIYFDTINAATCLKIFADTVFVNPVPTAAISPSAITICSGSSTTLTASGGATYIWNTGAVTAAITVSPVSTTSYTVTVTSANGCTSSAIATVTVNTSPTALITPASASICSGTIQTLTASGGVTYLWNTGAVTAAIMVAPPTTTTYTVTVTAANGCTATKTATITVITGVGITETHVEPTSCVSLNGSIDITVTGSGGFTYFWSTPDGAGLIPTNEDQTGLSVGTYNVTVTSNNGCTGTKSIALIGPGNCGGCPSIGSLTTNVATVCKTTSFTSTASGLTNMGGTFGIIFKYSLVALPDPYVGGTIFGTVPNSGLTGGGTTATFTGNIPVTGNYFFYAIVTPTPPNTNCRPSKSSTINILSCTAVITDPCSCKNNATTLINGQFNETVTVNAPSGQVWTVSSAPGFFLSTSPAPPAAPLVTPPGSLLTETSLGNGVSNYVRTGVHVDASGYVLTVSNGSIVTSIGATCYYPNPSINGLASVYCQNDPPVTLMGSAQLGDGSGPAMGVGTFTINGNSATIFNPGLLGPGTHNVVFSFDAADGVPNGMHPGCIQAVSQSVVVNQTPTINTVANQVFCIGQTTAQITFAGAPAGTVFNWTRTAELIGLAATSGSGSVPSFVTTNAGTTPLTSTFTVTPSFTNAGKTCLGTPLIFTITVNPATSANQVPDVQYCHGDVTTAINFVGFAPGTIFNWTRTPEPIGLAALSGVNSVPSFVTTNPSAARITSTFTVIPVFTNGGVTCTGTAMIFRISVLPQPVARCKNATIYLDKTGMITLTVPDVDNGSTGARTLTLSKSLFACSNTGTNTVTLTATDSCGKTSSCMSTVTVLDTIRPIINCPKDWTVNLNPGECNRIINYNIPDATDNCNQTKTTSTATITTAFNSNNQFAGNMFNITNTSSGPITLNSFAGNIIGTVGASCQVSVYYAPMTYVGKETNAAAWTLMGTGMGTCAGLNLPTLFNIGGLVIQPGETYGIFFYLDSYGAFSLRYTNGNNTFSNGDLTLTLGVGKGNPVFTGATFATRYWNGTIGYTKEIILGAPPVVTQIDNSGKKTGDVFPRGTTCQTFRATDFSGNSSSCTFCITIQEFQNPVAFLTCHDEIEVSLNENCFATIGADEVLSGGPYGCFDDYIVIVQDWVTGQVIDRQPNVPGIQFGVQDINHEYKITIRDSKTGNSCWGHAKVEDKIAPKMVCARDTCIICGTSATTPFYMGTPVVTENCGSYSLTYKDDVTHGSCAVNYEQIIVRTWIAIDAQGNKSSCKQVITVALATINSVVVPHDFDDVDFASLSCDGKINKAKDYTPHYLPYPYCVDGYLLDSTLWKATGGFYPSPNGDLAGVRRPRILGWNAIDTGLYEGHPSPFGVYYPAHPNWRPNNPVCWGPDEVIMWQGTGYPTGSGCLNMGITFRDIKIDVGTPNCDAGPIGCYKIIRQWTVLDWCTSIIGGHNQIIKVNDKVGPEILYPDTVIVNMESLKCYGIWQVPKPWLVDNCSNTIHYSVKISSGDVTGNETDGFVIRNIERGLNTAEIIAEDCCGNVTKHRVAVNVPDNTPPFANCELKTIVSITGNQTPGENFAKVFAIDLNQGSFDNCAPHVFFKVIKMDNLRGTNNGSNTSQPDNGTNCNGVNGDDNAILDGNQIYFDDYVNFCCTDVGKSYTVVLRVFDVEPGNGPISPSRMNPAGNLFNHYNDCMIEVEVQDKGVPTVAPPPNIVVSCSFWFNVDNISNPNDPTFGRVVSDLSLRQKVTTNDIVCHKYCERNDITGYPGFVPGAPPSNPPAWNKACDFYRVMFDTAHKDRRYDMVWGFDGTVLGTCGVNYSISVNDNRECGQGQITRTIVARGPNGISVTATQTIWVVDCDPFYINRADDCDALDDITWPGNCNGKATTIEGCGADISPENPLLGKPVIENNADDLCALISIEYVDEIFTIEPDACFKVLRKWIVIDWCQYDPSLDPVKGRWEYHQIIKVHDTDKPEITISVGNCEAAVKHDFDQICYGHISLVADATDNCSPVDWLFYDYKIDLYNDGLGKYSGFDVKSGQLTRKDFAAGKTPQYHDNPYAENANNPFDASGTYPVGIHKICWYVEDGCGNIAAKCQLFEIKDCKAPTPYCDNGVIITVMPSTGCITIWAKDLDRGSFDNCTVKDNLKFYFDGDPTKTSVTICCEDFKTAGVDDELIKEVRLFVEDEEGNTDFCITAILVQDPQNICPNAGHFGKISGELKTENDQSTEKVETRMFQSGLMMKRMTTTSNGQYFFGQLAFGSAMNYQIKPKRDDEPLNGVTTADIVKIQRHILGIETLSSPYKLIAADVNNTNTITASDISEIRKLILGVTERFSKNESWTFVPADYVFPDKLVPYNAPRDVMVNVLDPISYREDFIAIKIGDVTNSARAHDYGSSLQRNNGKLHFEIENGKVVAGELYKVEFKSSDFNNIIGYQFTLKFDQKNLSFESIESGTLGVDNSNFGTNRTELGILTTSWNNKTALTQGKDATLFTVVFRALTNESIGSLIAITDDVTKAEAYDVNLNSKDITLGVRTDVGVVESGLFELYQNTPNPFNKVTVINFRLPNAEAAKLSIYDLTGKVLRVYEIQGVKGINSLRIDKTDLNGNGILYYQLDAASHSATKQMILMD